MKFQKINKTIEITLILALMLFLPATSSHATQSHLRNSTIVNILKVKGEFTTLLTALEITGLDKTLEGDDRLTLFAPTDDAFDRLPAGTIDFLIDNPDQLAEVLLYHVVDGRRSSFRLVRKTATDTLIGVPVIVANGRDYAMVNGIDILEKNVWAKNGYIHVIDDVLLAPDDDVEIESVVDVLSVDGRFKTLIAALQAAGLAETIADASSLTIYAPTDEAFAKLGEQQINDLLENPDLLGQILKYHVSDKKLRALRLAIRGKAETLQGEFVTVDREGKKLFINDAEVINMNVQTPNAVVHTIDSVLLPPSLQ